MSGALAALPAGVRHGPEAHLVYSADSDIIRNRDKIILRINWERKM
jgi:hypothetical protein